MVQPVGECMDDVLSNRLGYYRLRQQMVEHFWQRLSQDYLHQLQTRCKWKIAQRNIKINDLVLIKKENTSPTDWPRGRVVEVYLGKGGLVRNAVTKTSSGNFNRSVQHLCPLPRDDIGINPKGAECRGHMDGDTGNQDIE